MDRRDAIKTSLLGLAVAALPSGAAPTAAKPAPQRQRVAWRRGDETLQLALTRQPASGDAVLYVHGATFPAALSVGWKMGGVSWLDHWQNAGLDAWALDFAGYGHSDRPRVFEADALSAPPFGRCADAAAQIGVALRRIREIRPDAPIHVVAHSWGTLPAQQAAIDYPELASRLVLFGPVATREGPRENAPAPAWSLIDAAHQRPRQRTGLPANAPTPVSEAEIDRWCAAYLDSDPTSTQRTPRSAKVPNGPGADIDALWAGESLVDSARIRQPVLIVRGDWDHITADADAKRLYDALTGTRDKRDVKISGGNHWLHLQPRREALWAETLSFLREGARA
ncbi:MAG TPA: alpha/beta fold hydrolase [Luteimonas sp.]|nr:alpha/beta fold hydrolase [Luteimonas sp.]